MATISNPFVMEVPRKLTDEELVNAIRQDIIGELEAIHEYDAHVQATDNEDAKKVLSDIPVSYTHLPRQGSQVRPDRTSDLAVSQPSAPERSR